MQFMVFFNSMSQIMLLLYFISRLFKEKSNELLISSKGVYPIQNAPGLNQLPSPSPSNRTCSSNAFCPDPALTLWNL